MLMLMPARAERCKLIMPETKTSKPKKNNRSAILLVVATIILVAGIITLVAGSNKGWWGDESGAPAGRPENQVLGVLYENPSGTFRVELPAEPSVINVDYSGFPMVNYYAIDTTTGDEYTVSHVRDVKSVFGVDGRAFLVWVGEEFIKTLAEDASGSEYMLLKNEMVGDDRELEAQIYNQDNGDYVRYRLIGRENQLMILKAEGQMDRVRNYEDFGRSFDWLSLVNNDVLAPILTQEEITGLETGEEMPKAYLEEGLILVRRGEGGEMMAVPENEVGEGDVVIDVERI